MADVSTTRPITWPVKSFSYVGGVVRERLEELPVIGWQGQHPIVQQKDGKHLVVQNG